MITAARPRPVRIAPRMAVAARALDTVGPALCQHHHARQSLQPNRRSTAADPGHRSARDRHDAMEILASRMLFRPADYQRSLSFYRDQIGLAIAREYGAGTVFFAGQSLIELAGYGAPDHSRGPVPRRAVATGPRPRGDPGRAAKPRRADRPRGAPRTVGAARDARDRPGRNNADLRPDSARTTRCAATPEVNVGEVRLTER